MLDSHNLRQLMYSSQMWQNNKYSGRMVINRKCIHEDVIIRLNLGNGCKNPVHNFSCPPISYLKYIQNTELQFYQFLVWV
jgi:hypothetical protein